MVSYKYNVTIQWQTTMFLGWVYHMHALTIFLNLQNEQLPTKIHGKQ